MVIVIQLLLDGVLQRFTAGVIHGRQADAPVGSNRFPFQHQGVLLRGGVRAGGSG